MSLSSIPDNPSLLPSDLRPGAPRRDGVDYLVFKSAGLGSGRVELKGDLRFVLWRPAPWRIRPLTLGRKSALWWLAHYLRVFRNRDYSVLLIVKGDRIAHRSCAIPACFRWRFMPPDDLQISSTWTEPECRGRGLATIALRKLMVFEPPGPPVLVPHQSEQRRLGGGLPQGRFSVCRHGTPHEPPGNANPGVVRDVPGRDG